MEQDVYERADWLVGYLEDHEEVAHAEVGAVERTGFDVVARDGAARAHGLDDAGIWFRLLAAGAADYRHTTVLERDNLEDLVDRAVRSGTQLAQDEPERYDAASLHRGVHPGWASGGRLGGIDPDAVAERLEDAIDEALAGIETDRSRVELRGVQVDEARMTTTGSVVRLGRDPVYLDTTVVPAGGPKLRTHAGSTTGQRFLDRLEDPLTAAASRARSAAAAEVGTIAGGRHEVLFGPRATAEAFHQVSHFLERDTTYMGAEPFAEGDAIAPESVTVHDLIQPGSWSAQAYDAECSPTQPVTLIENGTVTGFMDTVTSAAVEESTPHGHTVPSLSADNAPRIHARHLDVEAGAASTDELLAGADVAVDLLGPGRIKNEATRTKRSSAFPPSVLYARDISEQTPSEYDEVTDQVIEFPVREGYLVVDGGRAARIDGASIEFALDDLTTISGVAAERESVTGTCEKHNSRLPYSVTAPAVRVETTIDA